MPEKTAGTCKQKGCTVQNNGKCLEGFEKHTDCPHFIVIDESLEQNVSDNAKAIEQEKSGAMIDLYDGDGLNPETAGNITRKSMTRLIVVAGAYQSGKTTILASIYECFLKGEFAGYMFAGSQTLPGYEQKCHLARIASDRESPDTQRTTQTSASLLHLSVKDLSNSYQDILFTDLPGETFRQAIDSTSFCKQLSVIRMADYFVLLLDGEKLCKIEQRQEVFQDAKTLLRSCLDSDMLRRDCFADVLVTKWDLIDSIKDDNKKQAESFIQHIQKEIEKQLKERVKRLRFFNVAARPDKDSDLEFAYGLKEIFPSWVQDVASCSPFVPHKEIKPVSGREFDMYIYRRLKS
jgi:hypothetical protein